MLSTAIFVYSATSPVNGYFGASLYARQGGKLLSCFTFLIIVLYGEVPIFYFCTNIKCLPGVGSFRFSLNKCKIFGVYLTSILFPVQHWLCFLTKNS